MNVYRDGDAVVVPIEGSCFPHRCIKTNALLDSPNFKLALDLFPRHFGDKFNENRMTSEIGVGLEMARMSTRVKKVEFEFGLSQSLQDRSNWFWRCGLIMIICGPILAFVLGVSLDTSDFKGGETIPSLGGILGFVFGFSVLIAGIIVFAISSWQVMSILKAEGNYVWLRGAGQPFLDSLEKYGSFSELVEAAGTQELE